MAKSKELKKNIATFGEQNQPYMNRYIHERIALLRNWMSQQGLEAFIIPTTDPHNSEYVAEHWKSRCWITGFTGSAGCAVVTMKRAALWTDSRYFLQAEEQLKDSGILLMKEKLPETPSIGQWLKKELKGEPRVGIDGWVDNGSFASDIKQHLQTALIYCGDPFEVIWKDRPPLPQEPLFILDECFTGKSCQTKIEEIKTAYRQQQCTGILLSALDEIAWTLNLRCNDVHCNPVFISYLLITDKNYTLYIYMDKLTDDVKAYLKANSIEVKPYKDIERDLKRQTQRKIAISSTLNGQLKAAIKKPVSLSPSIVSLMKCVKNETEQAGFRKAMERDGVAMVKFLKWLKPAVEAGGQTELSIDKKLYEYRSEQAHFKGISFDTIAGYGTHAAIVHYEATPETNIPLETHGLLLLDSGAQYLDGTTDLTRTIPLGPLTEEEKRYYTLVLKGMLHIMNIQFPEGTCGTQLDVLARQFMWKEGINYLHGTGHGIGSFLCVHEGPHQIRMNHVPTQLQPGMIVTDEPGIYKAGSHGIRIENTLMIVPAQETCFGRFFKFEALTLCPIQKEAICLEMMNDEEKEWLNNYHAEVFNRLSPLLDKEHCEWLKQQCEPI